MFWAGVLTGAAALFLIEALGIVVAASIGGALERRRRGGGGR